jgi:5-methylcytosine-specific restriction protein A
MTRSLDEWIGKTDDAAVPPRVRLRRFDAFGGICYLSGRKIRAGEKWELHHIIALINGGQHRESNLAPVLADAHKKQTKLDVAEKKMLNRKRSKHLGIKSQTIGQRKAFQSKFKRKISGEVVLR